MNITTIAHVVHEANRALQIELGDPAPSLPWDEAADWQRKVTKESVIEALARQTPQEQHETWAAAKIRDGWVYGEVKDAEAKTHPCLVDYDELPEGQKAKDQLLLAIVGALRSVG